MNVTFTFVSTIDIVPDEGIKIINSEKEQEGKHSSSNSNNPT